MSYDEFRKVDIMIKNYMEKIVEDMLPNILRDYVDICKCEKCINDIKCITLNNLKPTYFGSDMGGVFLKVDGLKIQYKTDIINQTTKAIEIVSKNVRHDSLQE